MTELREATGFLERATTVCVLTGAGISAESGLQTFRAADGLWEDHRIEDVATPEGFARNPRLVWRFYQERRRSATAVKANPGHRALVRLEQKLRQRARHGHSKEIQAGLRTPLTILTQNVDGLHQAAGSESVVELHGSLWRIRCTECHQVSEDRARELPELPLCVRCRGLLRPHIIWFGEPLEETVLAEAEDALAQCDLFLSIGTSALVQPAASFAMAALRRGVPVIEVNLEETPLTDFATVSLRGRAGELLPKLVGD